MDLVDSAIHSAELDNKLVWEISHKEPIELSDLSGSLYGLAEQYKRFVATDSSLGDVQNARLYVKEVRKGSIIVEMIDQLPIPLLADANTLMAFSAYLFKIYDYFKGKTKDKPPVDRIDLEQCSGIVKPIVKDNAAQINVSVNVNGNITNHYSINSLESNAIQNRIGGELASMAEPKQNLKTKELMYWYQAKNDPAATTGDRAIIESISRKPVKVCFHDDLMKADILADSHNIFQMAYIVDVEVQTIAGVPSVYKVRRIHDSFQRELPPAKRGLPPPTRKSRGKKNGTRLS